MNKNRFISALKREKTDRVPVVPKIWVDFAAKYTNTSFYDIITNPLTALSVIAKTGFELNLDAVRQFPFPKKQIIEENGELFEIRGNRRIGKIDIQGGLSTHLFDCRDYDISNPFTTAYCHSWSCAEPLINNVQDARRIAVPDAKVFDELGWAGMQKIVMDEYAGKLEFIGDCDSATLSYYITFRGINEAMFDLITSPKLVHSVMEKGAQTAVNRGKYWLDNGIRVLRLNDSAGTMSLISPQHWREFIYPYIKTVCEQLHRHNSEAIIYCHICGNILPIAQDLINAGLDCIAPLDPLGGFTVADVRKKVGRGVALMGGVDTLALLSASPSEIMQAAAQCIRGSGGDSGFILGSGCVVPRDCPPQNIKALVEASRQHPC